MRLEYLEDPNPATPRVLLLHGDEPEAVRVLLRSILELADGDIPPDFRVMPRLDSSGLTVAR